MSTLPIHQTMRRSSRLNQAIALTVQGADVTRAPYLEHVSTLTVSCHGCKYRSKNKVQLGDLVLLALGNSDRRSAPTRGRVKHVLQLAADEMPFEVALELESPGNIWAIAAPPQDWFTVHEPVPSEPAISGLRLLSRNETPLAPTLVSSAPVAAVPVSLAPATVEKTNGSALGASSPFLAQFMVGLNEQIRVIASDAATAAIVKDKSRLLDEFRAQLQEEARRTLEHAIVAARDSAGSKVLKELNTAHEAVARATYERWVKKLEQDFAETAQRSVSLGSKVNERLEQAATSIAERTQQTLDASRREAVDQFRARLRSEVTPLVEETQAVVLKLAAFQDEVKVRSLEICGQFSDFLKEETEKSTAEIQERVSQVDQQIAGAVQERLGKEIEELEKRTSAAAAAFSESLQKLAQECEVATRERLQSLAASNAEQAVDQVKERIANLSGQFSSELEGYRSYLQRISASIAEIANKPAIGVPD